MAGRKPWSEEIKRQAKDLYMRGWSYQRIANKLQVPLRTIGYWAKKEGWIEERQRRLVIDKGTELLASQREIPPNMAERILGDWVRKGERIDDLLDRISQLATRLDAMAQEKPKELSRAIWALSQALDALLAARAEERQFLKLVVDAKLAEIQARGEDIIRIEVADED